MYTFQYVKRLRQVQKPEDYESFAIIYEPGQHFLLKATRAQNLPGSETRPRLYASHIENQPKNQFTVLVKLYEHGKMSLFFRRLRLGVKTLWRGPYGDYKINAEEKNLLFIAQGTGIAPFYSILCNMLQNEECYTFLTLFFCCNSDNLLFRNEFYDLTRYWNFKYEIFVSNILELSDFKVKYNEKINFFRLNIDVIRQYINGQKGNMKILICGGDSFSKNISILLMDCNISSDDIVIF